MRMSSSFVVLFCGNCGYEEEIHYKEAERRSLRCPQCRHYIDYEESALDEISYDDVLDELDLDEF